MKNLIKAMCALALCMVCSSAVAKHYREGSAECRDELKPRYSEVNTPADTKCQPNCHLVKKQEVVCHNEEICAPVCPIKKCHTEKRIVPITYEKEVCDTVCEWVCPAPKPECHKCHKRVCDCIGCHDCHSGRIYKEVRSEDKAEVRQARQVQVDEMPARRAVRRPLARA